MTSKKSAPPIAPTPKYRDAGTGLYVKQGYAKTHPKTTVREIDKPSPKGK